MIIYNGPYTVYVLISKTTGKLYVGITRLKPEERFHNGEEYRHNKAFYSLIKEYGWDDIEQNIFALNLTKEEAENTEKLLIQKFREQNPELITNRDAGGMHGKHCQETKEIIRKYNVGRGFSPEAIEKIKAARARQVFSEETIQKRAEKNRGKKRSAEFCKKVSERSSKKIKCIENDKVYNSLKEAALDLDLTVSGISQHVNGKFSHVKGKHFEFV